jgi:NifB/MoaA-like Fe-S oxidoreductase
MVYGLFSAFDLPATAQTLSSMGINKINLMPIGKHNEMNLSYMPPEIRQQAVDSLQQLVAEHQQRMGVDANLYPIEGIEEIMAGLGKNNNVILSRNQILRKIKWFDNWQKTNKFADLWPNVMDKINTLD